MLFAVISSLCGGLLKPINQSINRLLAAKVCVCLYDNNDYAASIAVSLHGLIYLGGYTFSEHYTVEIRTHVRSNCYQYP